MASLFCLLSLASGLSSQVLTAFWSLCLPCLLLLAWLYPRVRAGCIPRADSSEAMDLSMGGEIRDEEQRQTIRGSLGLGQRWMSLDDLAWDKSCGEQPTGTLGIRDPSGLWLWLELDESCSGCGFATWDVTGERAQLCVDLNPIRDTLELMSLAEPWW